MIKKIGIGIVILLLIVSIGVFYVVSNLDAIVKNVVESQGSSALGVPVTVAGVAIDLKAGRAELSGFEIANPDGFSSDYAMRYGRVVADLDLASLGTEVIKISRVEVNSVHIIAEQTAGKINLDQLLKNVSSSSDDTESDEEGADVNLIIEKFTLTQPKMDLIGFDEKDIEIEMGDVTVRNIGDPDSGAGAAEIAQQLFTPVLKKAAEEAAKTALKRKLLGEEGEAAKKLGDLLKLGD